MILLIDNYDSFVFNVKSMLEQLSNDEILVRRNDAISLSEIKNLNPTHIILSPGPKHPSQSGICLEIFKARLNIPVLGICLGHQALALAFDSLVVKMQEPMHAKNSLIKQCRENELFSNLPSNFSVMRYHSLEVKQLSDELEILALDEKGVIMALGHKNLPYYGVQFHPESYFSEYGLQLFSNFLKQDIKKPQKQENPLSFYLQKMSENHFLQSDDFEQICKIIMSKDYEILQVVALLILITEKSLNEKSLSAFVRQILRYSQTFSDESEMIDICGTGGDGFKSINVSTTSAFILAALGVKVAKHGNRAISSSSGSTDVLEALNITTPNTLESVLKQLNNQGLSFLHAPFFHPLVGELKEIRSRLGVRTVFNVLGPLLHPNLKLKYQLMGNYHAPVHRLLIEVLKNLGRKKALVVRGNDGMDELSICDESKIYELCEGEILEYSICPEQFGFKRAFHSEIIGSSAYDNAKDLKDILSGRMQGAKFDLVVLNAMFALYTANKASSPLVAKDMILEAIYSGKVIEYFKEYQAYAKA
ncbi:anthranilate phosphoribosyltransferase [Campylobacter jejuni]|uniref:Anthranilate phosphoribosyltransferase n=2 Tax=Campylobacter jejuni TaxID=197 RepID=Q0PBG3_CAMJE|nr:MULTISPECIES: anthranilate phosphoribosyltransferase [Campylobacter]YP_002343784.1 anthranilate synthase subunit II [Campylobacter jejuni subsp. jejuni NCTC 11168 = ATCC 700819]APA80635.1 Anthranilate synthase, amidotransferase component / Anthranilate phosphoribosyltransferase [Campylobacter jejuni subsp. jejuni D42a]EAI3656662.1 anthranilate phosphoribosyltransferase [Campylobacter fetus]EFV07176.1 anthranilate phosphoribosyltransferase [Campylobacter jejuni subsp. jejuni DFVF1099]EFV0967